MSDSLRDYFESTKGLGILATATRQGEVNTAVYARPHVMEDGSLAFVMAERLTYANLQDNPHASFLFKEEGDGYRGKRLAMTRVREEGDGPLLQSLRRRQYAPEDEARVGPLHLVYFQLDRELPLIGEGPTA